jgi:hypothetical protein
MELFDHLKNITTTKELKDFSSDIVKKSYEPYMIDRFVSMCDMYLDVACDASRLNVDKETHQRFYISILPKRYVKFEYIKKRKDSLDKDDTRKLYDYFGFGTNDFENIIDQLDDDTIQEIIHKYDSGLMKRGKK